QDTGKPAKIVVRTLDSDAQVNAIKSGQIDITTWSKETTPFQSGLDSGQLKYVPMTGVLNPLAINFNRTKPPVDDRRVREAVNFAINRTAIVKSFLPTSKNGDPGATPRTQPWPEGLPGFASQREDHFEYDPDKAKELLQQAGHGDGLDAGTML